MKRKLSLLLVLVLVVTTLFVACKGEGSEGDDPEPVKETVVYGHYYITGTFDPFKVQDSVEYFNVGQIFDPLVYYSEYDGIVPIIAESWEMSKDAMEYTFKLNEGIKFHDGSILTADDVKFSIDEFLRVDANMLALSAQGIDKVEVLDTNSVKISLLYPDSSFLKKLTELVIAPKKVFEEAGEEWGISVIVGSGPYKFMEYREGELVKLERFDDYFRGPARIKYVEIVPMGDPSTALASLETGEIDFTPNLNPTDVEIIANNPELTLYKYDTTQLQCMIFNTAQAPFDNNRVRQAFNYALDASATIIAERNGLGKTPTNFFLPDGVEGGRTDDAVAPYPYNPEMAKQILEEEGFDFNTEIPVYQIPFYGGKATEVFVNNLTSIGVNAVLTAVDPHPVFIGDYGVAFFAFSNKWNDGSELGGLYLSSSINNFGKYSNAEFDRLIEQAKNTIEDEERANLYYEAVKILREDAVIIPFFYEEAIEASRADLKGFRPQAYTGRPNFYDLYFEE